MAQFVGSTKVCATCAYWAGARESDYPGLNVQVGSATEKGKCVIPSGGWKGYQRDANVSCPSWKKWPALK